MGWKWETDQTRAVGAGDRGLSVAITVGGWPVPGRGENPFASVTGLRCRFSAHNLGAVEGRANPTSAPSPANRGSRLPTSTCRTARLKSRAPGSPLRHHDAVGRQPVRDREFARSAPRDDGLRDRELTRQLKAVRAEYSYVYLTVPPFVPDPTVSHSYGECQPATAGRCSRQPLNDGV